MEKLPSTIYFLQVSKKEQRSKIIKNKKL